MKKPVCICGCSMKKAGKLERGFPYDFQWYKCDKCGEVKILVV